MPTPDRVMHLAIRLAPCEALLSSWANAGLPSYRWPRQDSMLFRLTALAERLGHSAAALDACGPAARTGPRMLGRRASDQKSFRRPRSHVSGPLRKPESQSVESLQQKEGSHAEPFDDSARDSTSRRGTRPAWRRDRRAVRPPRRGHRAPARADPRVRRTRRLEHGLLLLRGLALLAGGAGPGRGPGTGPGRARLRDAAPAGPGAGPPPAVLRPRS